MLPSGEKATELTQNVCPDSIVEDPVATSHNLTVWSPDPDATNTAIARKGY